MEIRFELEVGRRSVDASVNLPQAPLRVAELLPVLLALDDAFIEAILDQAREQGIRIPCHEGCAACCRQLVPLSEPEAFYLARLVAGMPPGGRAAVEAGFRHAIQALDRHGLLEPLRNPGESDSLKLGQAYLACGIPCPFLENERCSIYGNRPARCREFLVSSAAAQCASPDPGTVRRLPLPAYLSETLYRFPDGNREGPRRTVPLVLALEWAAAHDETARPALPAPDLFRNFVTQLAEGARYG